MMVACEDFAATSGDLPKGDGAWQDARNGRDLRSSIGFGDEAKTVLVSVVAAGRQVLWVALLSLPITFVFAFALSTACPVGAGVDETEWRSCRLYWGSLSQAMYSLLAVVTGGVDWRDAADPLQPVLRAVLLAYVVLVGGALLAALAGLVVDAVLARSPAARGRHEETQGELVELRQELAEMRKAFASTFDPQGQTQRLPIV